MHEVDLCHKSCNIVQSFIQDFFLEGGRVFLYMCPLHSMLHSFIHMKTATLDNISYAISCYFSKTWGGETSPGG